MLICFVFGYFVQASIIPRLNICVLSIFFNSTEKQIEGMRGRNEKTENCHLFLIRGVSFTFAPIPPLFQSSG